MNEINTLGGQKLSGVDVRPADRDDLRPISLSPATPGDGLQVVEENADAAAADSVQPTDPLLEAENKLNDIIGNRIGSRRLRIEIDEETQRFVYKSVDKETGEVISQFPPQEILDLITAIREFAGLTFDQKA